MRGSTVVALAGLIPIVAANIAFQININAGLEACFPYWEGCYSVSRGIRSGSGLIIFKTLSIPTAVMMVWCWILTGGWLKQHCGLSGAKETWITWLGIAGAVFFVVYALWLGTDGEFYSWMRRYGVVFYFAFTALAQLLLADLLWNHRKNLMNGALRRQITFYFLLVVLMWTLGIMSAFKRKLIDNPAYLDRVENLLEWNFALVLSLSYIALAMILRVAETRRVTV